MSLQTLRSLVLGRTNRTDGATSHPGGKIPKALYSLGRPFSRLAMVWTLARTIHPLLVPMVATVAYLLATSAVGSGDYGQWLMASRYYLGEDTPGYRNLWSLPPVVPALLSITRLLVWDPIAALQVFRILLAIGLVLAFYAAGTAVFRRKSAGVLSAAVALLTTDRFLELFAFGGLLQIGSIIFMLAGIAAFAQAGASPKPQERWWILGSICTALAALSHVGTGIIAILAATAVAMVSVSRPSNLSLVQRARALAPLFVILAAFSTYWFTALFSTNLEYASNPASLSYRGPDRLWDGLVSYRPTLLLLAVGSLSLTLGALVELSTRRLGGYFIVAAWTVSTGILLAVSVVTEAATDYPRFAGPLLAPLAVAAGGGLASLSMWIAEGIWRTWPRAVAVKAPLALAGVIMLGLGPLAIRTHQQESRGYELPDMHALTVVAHWLDSHLPEGQSVLAPPREGKWIEGLTGREALFSTEVRYSFRPAERERSLAAEALLRSTTALANEFFFAKYVDSKLNEGGEVPREPWIAVNHGGEYVDLVRIRPTDTLALAGDSQGGVLATLNALYAESVEWSANGEGIWVKTVWTGERRGGAVSYIRTLFLGAASNTLELVDTIDSDVAVQEMQVEITPVPGLTPTAVDVSPEQADFYFPRMGREQPHLRLTASGGDIQMEPTQEGVRVRARNTRRLQLRFTVLTAGGPLSSSQLLFPQQLLEDYHVGAAVLRSDPSLEWRVRRLTALGFAAQMEVGPYVVMVREFPPVPEVRNEIDYEGLPSLRW